MSTCCMGCQLGRLKLVSENKAEIIFRTVCSKDGQIHERCADYCLTPPPFRQSSGQTVAVVEADDYGSSAMQKQEARKQERELNKDE